MKTNSISRFSKVAAAGSTSAIALMTASSPAFADGIYFGISQGVALGQNPNADIGRDYDYALTGGVTGAFVGGKRTLANGLIVGAELAYNGLTEGGNDANGNMLAGYDYGYDIQYTLDAKLRVGTALGDKIEVYGFAGYSSGAGTGWRSDYTGYNFSGANFGGGVEYEVADGMSLGLEVISRSLTGYEGTAANSQAVSLRASFEF